MQSTADKVSAYYKELQKTGMPLDVIEDIVKDAAQTLVMHHGLDVHPTETTTPAALPPRR
ncbi:hypothetical protein ACFRH6_14480 [Streptomyces sp. NPDC056749]|uniref:hypothetical protein n=1 Tax=Streptomyces sp. NPDC056749 TaxID=3345936 RepID=UPI0036C06B7A